MKRLALTVDVEDYYQVTAFEELVPRSRWHTMESRVEESTRKVLNVFADCRVTGTFFILGWVAERHPELVLEIASAGHEVAAHGYEHRLIYSQTPEKFRQSRRSKSILIFKEIDENSESINSLSIEDSKFFTNKLKEITKETAENNRR